ncbi:hypothetical protein ACFC34_38680 [Streptomyces sp. NPDC056053]|uniref:hypothetical protein n=1 Tax=Streptomyces sp. NPDC056053 TaxID=3345696 RepID=UPI0035DAF542
MARTAQHLAARAITVHGLAHPVALALLTAATTAAARAWDAGHAVNDIHLISRHTQANARRRRHRRP